MKLRNIEATTPEEEKTIPISCVTHETMPVPNVKGDNMLA
jgi:hypothetical protein